MNYDIFKNEFTAGIQDYFRNNNYTVSNSTEQRINGPEDMVMVCREEAGIGVSAGVKPAYDAYQHGDSLPEVILKTVEQIEEYLNKYELELMDLRFSINSIKENLVCDIVNKEANSDFLDEVPHEPVPGTDDLAVVARLEVNNAASLVISNKMCSLLKMTDQEVLECARTNTGRAEYECTSMKDMMLKMLDGKDMPEDFKEEIKAMFPPEQLSMYILTNPERSYGATAMLSRDALEMARNTIGEDYYILPSSRHELILVGKSEEISPLYLQEMVRDINATQVEKRDRLSDNIYQYDGKNISRFKLEELYKENDAEKAIDKIAAKRR